MGYNTTFLILNDSLGQLRKYPEEAIEGIHTLIAQGREGDVGVGNHANPIYVMATQHADVPRLYFTHGNMILELSKYNAKTMELVNGEEWRRKIVKDSIQRAEQELRALKLAIKEVETRE